MSEEYLAAARKTLLLFPTPVLFSAQWAEHFGVHVIVKDAAACARRAAGLVDSGDFPGVRVERPKDEPWGCRVTCIWDPYRHFPALLPADEKIAE